MEYLRQSRIIHGDLAARNILVGQVRLKFFKDKKGVCYISELANKTILLCF